MIDMKVGPFNKKLRLEFQELISIVATILTILLAFLDIEQIYRCYIGWLMLVSLISIYLYFWYRANHKRTCNFKINNTNITIKCGDIFKQPDIKIIAFNEFFDTQVDDNIIAANTVNGIYINKYSKGSKQLDEIIENESRLQKNVIEKNVLRTFGGKTIRYKLGSICPNGEFFLLAFTRFDKDNRAYISVEDYMLGLIYMWRELDRYYAGKDISLTLLGGGITRFNDRNITNQELIDCILFSFKVSKIKFTSSISIILTDSACNELNLYEIRGE
jgi:putative membrane protein